MNEDRKEEEIFTNERNRLRSKTQSPILQLQHKLEEIKQIKIDDNNKKMKELFINTIFEFMKSFNDNVDYASIVKHINPITDTQENDHIQVAKFQLLYNDALQTISRQKYELNQARLQCHLMAIKLSENDNNHKFVTENCNNDQKQQEITIHNIRDISEIDEIFAEKMKHKLNDNNQNMFMDSYETESDCSMNSDYKLLSNNVIFKPMDKYEPITFKNYIYFNEYIFDEYNGLQTDWESNDEYELEYDNENEDEKDEDECIELVNALNICRQKYDELQRENEMLTTDNIQHLDTINDIKNKYEKKCVEYEQLKRQLANII